MIEGLRDIISGKRVDYWQDRIISQLEFALKLSELHSGIHDDLIASIERFVMDCFSAEGVIGKETVLKAEEKLGTISEEAKKFRVLCAAHAHIDMNWMWKWNETVAVTLNTFQTMLALMNEYPDFKFSQSQASVYKIVEEYNPEMLEEIKRRVKEGRWEVTASTWVECDKNMPTGESLARHILYTKKYLSALLDIDPESLKLDFEPDTFGHSRNIPEILTKGGVKYYYHSRGNKENSLYKWRSPSGASIIVYRDPYFYGCGIDSSLATEVLELHKRFGMDTMLRVYGVGDHGGGPTRRDVERIIDMNSWPVFPKFTFGTYGEYFSIVELHSDRLPVVDRELNYIFDGCYTTQTRIKMANRYSEKLLNEAELFGSMANLFAGANYSGGDFSEAWRNVLFNQFHDILPGSGIVDTREYAMGLLQKATATANSQREIAFKKISERIDTSSLIPTSQDIGETTSEGAGVGFGIDNYKISQSSRGSGLSRIFHFFNPSLSDREETVEVVVWDWNGDMDRIEVKDKDGVPAKHQVVNFGTNDYWGHKYLNLLVNVKVPAYGYSTYTMSQGKAGGKRSHFDPGFELAEGQVVQKPFEFVQQNDLMKVVFDTRDASIISILDKASGEELVDKKTKAGIFRLIEEDDEALGMTAWIVGKYMNIENLHQNAKIKTKNGILRDSLSYTLDFRNSKLEVCVWLDKNSKFLHYDCKCHWCEVGKPHKYIPQLDFYLPVGFTCPAYKYDVPFGVVNRKEMDIDVPANGWAATMRSEKDAKDIMLVTDSKHGFRNMMNSMSVTLIRSSYDPDPYPEFGVHNFQFAIGLIDSSSANWELIRYAYDFNHPMSTYSGKAHKGTYGLANGFMSVEKGSVAISAIKVPENAKRSSMLIRLYETDGSKTEAVLKFNRKPEAAYIVDINEEKTVDAGAEASIDKESVIVDILPYSIVNLVVEWLDGR